MALDICYCILFLWHKSSQIRLPSFAKFPPINPDTAPEEEMVVKVSTPGVGGETLKWL